MVAAKVTSGEIPSSGPASTVPRMLLNETWEICRSFVPKIVGFTSFNPKKRGWCAVKNRSSAWKKWDLSKKTDGRMGYDGM